MLRLGLRLPVLAGLALAAGTASAQEAWPTYANVLHRYQICYPAALLVAQGEADNSAGQAFESADGARLAVWGDYSGEGKTLAAVRDTAAAFAAGSKGRVTYRAAGQTWAVASGENGTGEIFYLKLFKRGDQVVQAQLRHPASAANRYKPIVERITRCFRLAPGG